MSGARTARLVVRAVGVRAALPGLLHSLPLDRVLAYLTPAKDASRPLPTPLPRIERVTDALTRGVWPLRTACLTRALLRYHLLRTDGYPAVFVIGVRPGGVDDFEAHAWVELDGEAIMEREQTRCRPTLVWPKDAAAAGA